MVFGCYKKKKNCNKYLISKFKLPIMETLPFQIIELKKNGHSTSYGYLFNCG